MLNNNFYDIAFDDLAYLQIGINSIHYNPMIVSCQQISEKALKSVVELCCVDEKLIKSHNLRQLNSAILSASVDLSLNASDLAFLKDFYFDARYPGDNFVEVTKQEFIKALDIMYSILDAVNVFREDKGLDVKSFTRKYPGNMLDNFFESAISKMAE